MTQTTSDVPQDLTDLYGTEQYEEISEIPVEHGYIWTSCASVENGEPDLLGRVRRRGHHGRIHRTALHGLGLVQAASLGAGP